MQTYKATPTGNAGVKTQNPSGTSNFVRQGLQMLEELHMDSKTGGETPINTPHHGTDRQPRVTVLAPQKHPRCRQGGRSRVTFYR